MKYLPKAQEQMNGDLLVPEATKLFLHRAIADLKTRLEIQDPQSCDRAALLALESALGTCPGPLPTVREMLDLVYPEQERRSRNLLKLSTL
jgi:hypothetical protein